MLLRPIATEVAKSIGSLPPPIVAAGIAASQVLPQAAFLASIRGGGATATGAFNMGLAKTRLEGLGYSTVTSLVMNAALRLFSSTPKKLMPVSEGKDASRDRLNNYLKIAFSLCICISVALGAYTTVVFTLMSIYSKTALGMGLESQYLAFFDACAKYRQFGFRAFLGALTSYNFAWIFSILLNYDGKERWYFALPVILITIVGLTHFQDIIGLAGTLIFAS